MAGRSSWVRTLLRAAIGVLAVLALVVAAAAAAAWWWLDRPLPLAAERVELSVEPGTNPRDVAQAWVDAGVRVPARWLYEWFRWSGQARRIRAGSYEIHAGATPRSLLDKMVRGDETLEQVRFIEGWTLRQLRAELARAPHLRPASAGLSDAELMAALGSPGVPAEGRFFPDTYAYSRGVSDLTVLRRAHRTMQRRLEEVWAERAPDSPLKSPDEALILASIIEKETGRADERDRIAGVFVNRLNKGMPLQSDPTILYGIYGGGVQWGKPIMQSEKDAKNAHNTYQIKGLPPTPICNPGRPALEAALNPAQHGDLFFVADGSGGHIFTATLKDHNAAVSNWRKFEKEMRARQAAAKDGAPEGTEAAPGEVARNPITEIPNPPAEDAGGEAKAAGAAAEEKPAAVPATATASTMPLPIRKPKR